MESVKYFMNQKEKIERVKEFRLIDDVFFEVFARDIPACQEILRVILDDEKLMNSSLNPPFEMGVANFECSGNYI